MDAFEQCTHRIGLCLRPSEVARLEAYAREKGAPTLSAAIRAADASYDRSQDMPALHP